MLGIREITTALRRCPALGRWLQFLGSLRLFDIMVWGEGSNM